MKRLAFLLAFMVPFFMGSLTGCDKITDGTGTLTVHISNLEYDTDVRVYPYGFSDYSQPIASEKVTKGGNRSVTFTLNAGNYVVYVTNTQTVQIQEGQESHLYFNK
ncbi:MAG: hypothetical protein IJZ70_03710 [Bacteroidales bacterium]|nr:hypothetical protein [Bacteroidales bacterium]MBQ8811398.1 hypothetical protein [Bacteroidales bacterium]